MKLLIILGFVLIGVSIYLSTQSDEAKKHSDDADYKKYKLLSGVSMALAVCLIAGSGIAFLVGQSGSNKTGVNSSYSSKRDDFGHDETDAWVVAQSIVSKQLKSPSTADFCRKSQATIVRSGNTWTVVGYVDAQNSFGATLRNEFTVRFTFFSDNQYTTELCSIK